MQTAYIVAYVGDVCHITRNRCVELLIHTD